jgi:mRNA interferase RelE/StbE
MRVTFSKKFERQFDKIGNAKLQQQIRLAVKSIMDADRVENIPSVKKLKGFSNAYRVRSGRFRLGFIKEVDGSVFIAAFDDRKGFYSSFP